VGTAARPPRLPPSGSKLAACMIAVVPLAYLWGRRRSCSQPYPALASQPASCPATPASHVQAGSAGGQCRRAVQRAATAAHLSTPMRLHYRQPGPESERACAAPPAGGDGCLELLLARSPPGCWRQQACQAVELWVASRGDGAAGQRYEVMQVARWAGRRLPWRCGRARAGLPFWPPCRRDAGCARALRCSQVRQRGRQAAAVQAAQGHAVQRQGRGGRAAGLCLLQAAAGAQAGRAGGQAAVGRDAGGGAAGGVALTDARGCVCVCVGGGGGRRVQVGRVGQQVQ
jgi:hypothetical protein